jgi:hypothetical protein
MSGVLQHLEAGACAGGTEALDRIFAMVEEKITDATGARVKLLRDGRALVGGVCPLNSRCDERVRDAYCRMFLHGSNWEKLQCTLPLYIAESELV